ncbi:MULTISPECIES: sugar ABC transporter substrate-binding protein [unclassified Microbacterium]|uniref:sugar ABC transporter substrate-binding protein n=1 Tax=unclassified Microbacterium TaxID=2609290 RepID=UPI00343EC3A9
MKTRIITSVLVTAALGVALAGCSAGGGPDSSGETNIWYVNPLTSYPAWADSMQKFEDEAADGDYRATGVGPTKLDTATNVSQIEQAITDGADGVIFCNTDPASFESVITRAQDAGVVMVTIGCVDEVSDYSIGTDNVLFGETAAQTIAEGVGEDAVVGIVSTDQTTPNQLAQVTAFKDYIAKTYPDMKVAAWESDNSDSAVAAQKITGMLQANDDITAIWCVEGQCPGGVATGLGEAGKEPGDVFVLGIDTVETTISAIEDGWIQASLNQCWFDATTLATDLIKAKASGKDDAPQSWGIAVDPVTADDLPYAGCPADVIPSL